MALTERDAIRFAESLEGYEHVSVTDIGGTDEGGYCVVVRDHRFQLDYEISSHSAYWDFIAALVDHKQYLALPIRTEVAITGPLGKRPSD